MAKKYSKKGWGSLLQIRLSREEKDNVSSFIARFDVTQREFILAVMNELKDKTVIKNGVFECS